MPICNFLFTLLMMFSSCFLFYVLKFIKQFFDLHLDFVSEVENFSSVSNNKLCQTCFYYYICNFCILIRIFHCLLCAEYIQFYYLKTYVDIKLSQHQFLKRLSFSYLFNRLPLHRLHFHIYGTFWSFFLHWYFPLFL